MKMFPSPLWGGGILCRLLQRGGTWAGMLWCWAHFMHGTAPVLELNGQGFLPRLLD